jgi:hypothetical protein
VCFETISEHFFHLKDLRSLSSTWLMSEVASSLFSHYGSRLQARSRGVN